MKNIKLQCDDIEGEIIETYDGYFEKPHCVKVKYDSDKTVIVGLRNIVKYL